MPTPFLHLPIAHEAASLLRLAEEDLPLFLLGSVTPDVAALLGEPRSNTHFWTTSDDVSGVIKLLTGYPRLRARHLTTYDRTFMAGYLCHLIADEQWTFTIWRPYFGRYSTYGGNAVGTAFQSALRDALDEREYGASPNSPELASVLDRASTRSLSPNLLPFARDADLERNREVIVRGSRIPSGVERRLFWAQVTRREALKYSTADERAKVLEYVRPESIESFRRRSIEASAEVLQAYLEDRTIPVPLGTEVPEILI
jgi:hypothetical protein